MRIDGRILLVRNQRVLLDADLAERYGVQTKALNQAVKRNARRVPRDFTFQLTAAEKMEVVTHCDHLARLKFSTTLPLAFTEHGAIQAANVLNSEQAVEMGIYVVRAFVRQREMIISNKKLALRLDELEHKTEQICTRQERHEHDTGRELKQIVDAIRALMAPPPVARKRPIGFVTLEERTKK